MPISNLPAVLTPVLQTGYLERVFQEKLMPTLIYRALADRVPIPARIGETITKSRPGLLAPVVLDQSPSANTGLDNGLTSSLQTYEQFQATVGLFSGTMDLNLEQEKVLIAPLFEQQWETLATQAGTSIDTRDAQDLHTFYGAGNTWARTAVTASTISVDNIIGFRTAFASTNSPGLPAAVSTTNKLAIKITAANGTVTSVNVQGFTPDGTNASSANVNGIAYGISGTLTLDASVTTAIGDTVQAVDGAYVIRPNGKLSRWQLANTDVVTLQLFVQARAKLKARQVPPMANGLYACICDPLVMAQLYNDPQFIRATQGTWDRSTVFTNGVVAKALGLEFIDSSTIPTYTSPSLTGGVVAKRAIVCGAGALIECPFEGSLLAAKEGQGGLAISDIRVVKDIVMITRPAITRYGDSVAQTWKWTGGRVVPTDVTSNPLTIATSDYARHKRAVEIEVAASP